MACVWLVHQLPRRDNHIVFILFTGKGSNDVTISPVVEVCEETESTLVSAYLEHRIIGFVTVPISHVDDIETAREQWRKGSPQAIESRGRHDVVFRSFGRVYPVTDWPCIVTEEPQPE